MIAITGATGNIGRHLTALLTQAGAEARLLVRDLPPSGAGSARMEAVRIDLDHSETLDAALTGVHQLFLLSPGPDTPAQDAAAISAAQRAGVSHIVLLSSLGIEAGGIGGGRPHAPGEQVLKASGLDWTILRPSEYMTNTRGWLAEAKAHGAISVPSGSGKVGLIDPADIAAAAFAALTGSGHAGKTYRLTGPESLSVADVARRIGEVIGAPVIHRDITVEEFRRQGAATGMPPLLIDIFAEYYVGVAQGAMDILSGDVAQVVGRPATAYLDWLRGDVAASS